VLGEYGEHDYQLISRKESETDPCDGLGTEYYECTSCSTSMMKPVFGPGHTYDEYFIIRVATETEDGEACTRCSRCKKVLEGSSVVLPKIVTECQHATHSNRVIKEKTCISPAEYMKVCKTCGAELGTTSGTQLGEHKSDEGKVTKKATYAAEGTVTFKCLVCEKILKTESIPKLSVCDHKGTVYRVDIGSNQEEVHCSMCGECLWIESTEPICYHRTTHEELVRESTSTEEGLVNVVCDSCRSVRGTRTIPAYSAYCVDIGNGQYETVYGIFVDSEAQNVFALLNEYRQSMGLNALSWNSNMNQASRIRGYECAKNFSHTRPNGTPWYTVNETLLNGENIAVGYTTAESVMKGWKESKGHNDNMLYNRFSSVNIACFKTFKFTEGRYTPSSYSYIWVQEFSTH